MVTLKEVEARVVTIVAELLGISKETIHRDMSFREDLKADSLDAVEIMMELEEEFNIQIKDEDAEKAKTVGQAIDGIAELLGLKEETEMSSIAECYNPYYPQQIKQWEEGDRESVLIYFAEQSLKSLGLFCVDLFMSFCQDPKNIEDAVMVWLDDDALEEFGRELAWCEEEDFTEAQEAVEELFEEWKSGNINFNDKPYDYVARELIDSPACYVVAFMQRLLHQLPYPSNLLQVGYLGGALLRMEKENEPAGA